MRLPGGRLAALKSAPIQWLWVLVPLFLMFLVGSWWASYGLGPQPWGFRLCTGLAWPSKVRVVSFGDSHGGFQGDGIFHVVFDVDHETAQDWLAGPAPWGGDWKRGPIPATIWPSNLFGDLGDRTMDRFRKADGYWYAARRRDTGSSGLPPELQQHWRTGDLFVLDPESRRVWFASWD